MSEIIEQIIAEELAVANKKFPAFASTHEGWAVLFEEVAETNKEIDDINTVIMVLFEDIMKSHGYDELKADRISDIRHAAVNGIKELIQVAAMCDKFMALDKKWEAKIVSPDTKPCCEVRPSKYDTGSILSMGTLKPDKERTSDFVDAVSSGLDRTDPEIVETFFRIGQEATKTMNQLEHKCGNCKHMGFHYWTPWIEPPICLHPKNQRTETKATWSCPECEPKGIEKRTPSGDPLNMKETLAEKGAMSHEELEAFNKNNLSQKLKNRCRDCTKFVGDIFCATNTVRVDADWTCGAWTGKGE